MDILIVDDSPAMRMMIKKMLRQAGFTGHSITEAGDGREAFKMISDSLPDLVLADWNMPIMTGMELLEALREEGISVDFVFITTEGTAEMRKRAEEGGAKALIAKPFSEESFSLALGPILS